MAFDCGSGGGLWQLTAAFDGGKWATVLVAAANPLQLGRYCECNNSKDTSNRGNKTGNNQPVQQKVKRADKRSGAEDVVQGNQVVDNTTREGGLTT
jgi:hypothetical protein